MFEFNSAVELISHSIANSLFIFCFCNLIVVMILVGSKKPTSNSTKRPGQSTKRLYQQRDDTVEDRKVMMRGQKAESEDDREANDEGNDGNGDKDEEEDELRKRVEEFIEKVNKGWKAELLRTSHLARQAWATTLHKAGHMELV